ncbi:MAG: Asp-tRNA(Asn)/Glu-tRNA(Gln) amidotransferase subunit GatC [Eubacterium sp.]|nr:Asp-tRNA(Asn)/Glu-tRNA(Gln) amidotransferase subunit GatC [Eubacterium sp.]
MINGINRLAELESSDSEAERDISGLEDMIGYFNCISEVDTEGVKPLIQPFEDNEIPLREDVSADERNDVLSRNAPLMRDGMVVTPRSI